MQGTTKTVTPGKRVKIAAQKVAEHFEGDFRSDANFGKSSASNFSYSLTVKGNSFLFSGLGKGNSSWEVEVMSNGVWKCHKFVTIEDLADNLTFKVAGCEQHNKASLLKQLRMFVFELEDAAYPIRKESVSYDLVRWRRAKKDFSDCLHQSNDLYQEFAAECAQQILLGMELKPTPENMVSCLRAAQLSIKKICDSQ